ncbi:phenylalanine--tRNA ligase subunit alpha [Candidatus Dojkabacteria bacterium]|nr:phenylalanine--tRNA ligase subunit alpha [Candidatus Dojkabacteria bacterium]
MEKILIKLEKHITSAQEGLKKIDCEKKLDEFRVKSMGRKSQLTNILRSIKDLKTEEKVLVGKKANEIKGKLENMIENKMAELQKKKVSKLAETEWIDVTVPGKGHKPGHLHPTTQMMEYAEDIFQDMGFEIVYPNEIDDDYHNFTSLNMPEGHPARDAWDTFWTEEEHVMITHTSSMQNRILKSGSPPIRAIVPGKCFRNEATDARHEHTFYQFEGVYVDKGITLSDMIGTLQAFFNSFYERDLKVKFTPDFFPFVEPGGMVSLECVLCRGKGCRVCKYTGWLEILGCGMIHPNVLKEAGIDHKTYTGFAWGFGLERLIMLKYNIEDVRLFHSGDLRFVKQF